MRNILVGFKNLPNLPIGLNISDFVPKYPYHRILHYLVDPLLLVRNHVYFPSHRTEYF